MAAEQEQVNAMTTIGWFYFTGEFGAGKILNKRYIGIKSF